MSLPVNINELLSGHIVEWERIEFKKGWNPETTIHSICAFANDLNNWGGGYIIIGIEENNGTPILPPAGLETMQIDAIQKKIIELCNILQPSYYPKVQPLEIQNKMVLVIWAYGGDNRPYSAPETLGEQAQRRYYIRRYSTTKKASPSEEKELLSMAGKIPFDDRIQHSASLTDLNLTHIQKFLREIGSDLYQQSGNMPFPELCRNMQIAAGPDENLRPLNAGLLFFADNPQKYFPEAKIDVVIFKDDSGDDFSEKSFTGRVHEQLRDCLDYLKNMVITEHVHKVHGKAEAKRYFNYPFEAIEEALVNTAYHRSYEEREPVEIRVFPTKIEIISYPGPLPPITRETLQNNTSVVARQYRNRRIGDFLKELRLTEGRGTGFPKIRKALLLNGSPTPVFETDNERTYFLVTLPIHPELMATYKRNRILEMCRQPISRADLLTQIGVTNQTKNFNAHILPLITDGYLELTTPDKPNSKNQKYKVTEKGIGLLEKIPESSN